MPENASGIKESSNPLIQAEIDRRKSAILETHPDVNPVILNEQVRNRIAAEIRIERLRGELERKTKQSITDNLTGTLNATGFEQMMQIEGRRTLRTGKSMAIVVLDANDLRKLNLKGHAKGDEYLKSIADVLQKVSRASDIVGRRPNSEPTDTARVARWGGDEFGVILEETDLEGAKSWWNRAALEFRLNGISIGAGVQVLNPSELEGKTPGEVSAIIADKKHEADLAMMGVAKPESKKFNTPTLSIYNEIPQETRVHLPERIAQLQAAA